MKLYCDTCKRRGKVLELGEAPCKCPDYNGKGYTEISDIADLKVNEDCKENLAGLSYTDKVDSLMTVIEALVQDSKKYIELMTPYTPTELKSIRNYDENLTGRCKCGEIVYEFTKHCCNCGQKLSW